MNENTTSIVINNEYDYSNSLPTKETVTYLIQYCDQVYKQLIKLIEADEEKNKQFKYEYKEYMYKKCYSSGFEVFIREKSYNNITCKDYESFISSVKDGNLNQIASLDIKLDLDFERGKGDNFVKHENSFTILFKPYEIIFARKSNNNDDSMTQIENQIKSIMKRFPIANSIFCNKKEEN